MDKKYEILLEDKIEYKRKTLYKIRALRDFSNVKAGDIGGYIESEKNLSHHGSCWVYDNAWVYESSKVYDNARVYGNAEVYDKATVYGNSKVYGWAEAYGNIKVFGNAKVYEEARVYGNAIVCGNAVINKGNIIGYVSMPYKDIFQHQCKNRLLTAILTEDDRILYSIGCQENITKEEFLDSIYNEDGGLEENPHRKEYLRLIPLIETYFKGE